VVGVPLGRWQTNCYLIGDRDAGSCVVVDPGETSESAVPELLEQTGVSCEAILLTHGHLDHLWGVPSLARELAVPVLLHPEDRWIWDDPAAAFGAPPELLEQQFGLIWDPPTEHLRDVTDGDDVTFAGVTYRVQHNPGHTPGHVTYLGRGLADVPITFALGDADAAPDGVLFSGDLVFAGAMGRVDFPRGSMEAQMRSLHDTVLPLEDDTLVLAGHGPDTTVGRERATNAYLHQAASLHG
jgi:glyoxylase-like metal-dependent hydrolase (beta-lactamase superfamily II)